MTTTANQIKNILSANFSNASSIEANCEGNHCSVIILCSSFAGQSPVKRQQRVNACLKELIASGQIHALRIDARPPA